MNRAPAVEEIEGYFVPPEYPRNSTSNALEAGRLIPGPCRLFGFSGYNSKGAAQFILVFDSGDVPSGSEPPALAPMTVPTVANFSAYFGSVGRWFYRGIYICNSSTEPLLTAGSADCFFDVQYV